jgi:hypothetical protein
MNYEIANELTRHDDTPNLQGTTCVTTLALGLRPKQGFAKVRAKIEPGSHISCSRECKKV